MLNKIKKDCQLIDFGTVYQSGKLNTFIGRGVKKEEGFSIEAEPANKKGDRKDPLKRKSEAWKASVHLIFLRTRQPLF